MNIKLKALCLGGFLVLTSILAQPAKADEWNKRTEFQFSGPVEIPGKVLAAGKYVFQLEDSESDRDIVQIFSEDADGHESLVATLLAIPDELSETPDKPIIHFDEGSAGTPEAIHSWYYPGENTGWQFVYRKGETQTAGNQTAANISAPVPVTTAAAAPSLPKAPQIKDEEPASEAWAAVEEEEITIAQNEPPAQESAASPTQELDASNGEASSMLPMTAGHSGLELMLGLAMLGGGVAAVLASPGTSKA